VAFLKKDEFEIFYEVHKDDKGEEKPPLMLLAGMGRDHSVWDNYIEYLLPFFQVITMDNLGAGQTKCTKENFDMEDMANATQMVIEKVGLPVHLLGHSMGGYIAQNLCLYYPNSVKKLALFSTTACQGKVPRISTDTVIELRKRQVPFELVLNTFIPLAFSADFLNIDGVFDKIIEEMTSDRVAQTEKDFEKQAFACRAHDVREKLNQIKQTTLVCTGALDVLATPNDAKFIAKNLDNSSLEIVEGVGHVIQVEAAEKFMSLVLKFFAS